MSNQVFPWWKGYFLKCSIRKLYQNPDVILAPYVKPGMKVADIGCGMGFFTFPLLEKVGDKGRVVAVDLQQEMMREVEKKAKKMGGSPKLQMQVCSESSLKLEKWENSLDFILAFAIAHEVPDRDRFFKEVAAAMRPGARLLLAEPIGHVSEQCFNESIEFAKANGLIVLETPEVSLSRAVLLVK